MVLHGTIQDGNKKFYLQSLALWGKIIKNIGDISINETKMWGFGES